VFPHACTSRHHEKEFLMNNHSPTGHLGPDSADRSPDETVRLNHPRDLLTAVPFLLGFEPDPGSVVVVALRAGRVAVTIRVESHTLDDAPRVWARVQRPLREADVDEVAVVGYLPEHLAPQVLAFAAAAPVRRLDVLRVHQGRWWSLTCPNGPGCCPPGEPLSANAAVAAPLIAGAGAPAASRADLARCLQPGPGELVAAVAALLPLDPAPPAPELFRQVTAAHTERASGPRPLAPEQAAVLVHALTDVHVRDACCGWHDDAAWWLWTTLIRITPTTHVAPVASLIATTAYQRGDTVLARIAADHALAANPGYGLAQLMREVVVAQIHPAMVREVFADAIGALALLRPGLQPGSSGPADAPGESPATDHDSGRGASRDGGSDG
jgi:hypothetical protein